MTVLLVGACLHALCAPDAVLHAPNRDPLVSASLSLATCVRTNRHIFIYIVYSSIDWSFPFPPTPSLHGMCHKCCDAGRGNSQVCLYFTRCTRDVHDHSIFFKVYIDGMIVAVEAAKRGISMGGGTVSGLMFADDFMGIPETPERLRKQIQKALLRRSIVNRGKRLIMLQKLHPKFLIIFAISRP